VLPEEPEPPPSAPARPPRPPKKKPAGEAPPQKPPRASFPPPEETPAEPPPKPARKPRAKPQSTATPQAEPTREKPSHPPAVRPSQAPATDAKEKEEEDDNANGLFGPFRIGGLVGIGLPSVLTFGGAIKLTRYLGGGLNIGLIPTIRISLYGEAQLSYQEYDIYGRLFPFGGMFFVGAGAGYATMTGSFRSSYDVRAYQSIAPGLPDRLFVESKGSVRTLVLTPQIGVQHTFGSGLTLGMDAGLQIPLAPSEVDFSTELPAEVPPEVIEKFVEPNDAKVRDTLETVGRTIVPTLNLRIGWLL
jgi:hypothetical protein